MIISQKNSSGAQYDLCVIGAGPAGIMTALEASRREPNLRILLFDYGAPDLPAKNRLDDAIDIRNPLNHHDPYECTNKGLGGSSATWGGRCVMYDEIDFLPREIIGDNCTWDAALLDEINDFVPPAAEYFQCGTGPFDLKDSLAMKDRRIAEGFIPGEISDSVVERWSLPTRFGPLYEAEISAAPNLHLLLGVEARDFSAPDKKGNITELTIRNVADGSQTTVRAARFVIAAGTQESTRILLRNKQVFGSLKAVPPSLGHYYQGHVSGKIASVQFEGDPGKTDYGFIREPDGTYIRRRLQLSSRLLQRENLLNTAIWLDNPLYFDPSHRSGAMSFMYLAMITPVLGKRLAPPAIAHSVTKGKVTGVGRHLLNILRGLPSSLVIPGLTFFKRYCVKRKLPGVFLHSPKNRYALHFHAEQIPWFPNRMELADGSETLVIHYDLTEDDIHSVIRCHELLDEELRRQKAGRLDYWFPREELPDAIRRMSKDGIHQSGTTRIGDSPEKGVLDKDLKVWGTSNLFVCSASAFPTSGQANPTFLLGAFAVRLARHLVPTVAIENEEN